MIALDDVLEFGVVHVKMSSYSFFLLKGCDHKKFSSNQPERVSSLVVEICYAIYKLCVFLYWLLEVDIREMSMNVGSNHMEGSLNGVSIFLNFP